MDRCPIKDNHKGLVEIAAPGPTSQGEITEN